METDSFKFGFKGINRLSDVSRGVIQEKNGTVGKRPCSQLTSFKLWGQTGASETGEHGMEFKV